MWLGELFKIDAKNTSNAFKSDLIDKFVYFIEA